MSRGLPTSSTTIFPIIRKIISTRVGRSARMEAKGQAIAFITPEQGELLSGIEVLCNLMLREDQIPGFHAGLDDPPR